MRLSFGQELRMVQKQVLAPRMIQSMEILQLPIMALQERIEQEMQENPVLDLAEEDLDLPEEPVEEENPDAPSEEERELVVDETKNNEDDFERLLNMDEEWPDHFEERSRPSSTRVEEEGARKHDAMANMVARPAVAARLSARSARLVRLERRAAADGRPDHLQPRRQRLPARRLEDLVEPDATAEQLALAQQALALVQKLDPPGVAARDLRECLLLQLMPGMPYYEQLKTLISSHLEDLGAQPAAGHRAQDGLFDCPDSTGAGRAAQAESQAGREFRRYVRAQRHARRVRRAGRRRQVQGATGRRPHAEPVHQRLLPQAADERRGQRRDPRIHQAQDQFGPVADRIDRAAPQHADAGGAGDRRPPDRVS